MDLFIYFKDVTMWLHCILVHLILLSVFISVHLEPDLV